MGKGDKSSSSSSNQTRNTTSTTTNTQNLNLQGVQGKTVFTDGNVTINETLTDFKSVQGGLELGRNALILGDSAVVNMANMSKHYITEQAKTSARVMDLTLGISKGLDSYATKVTGLAQSVVTDDTAESVQTLVKYGAGAAALVAGSMIIAKAIK